ncbi:MAG: NYN domain-containing protein [Planctomycetota bacterium]
MANSNPDAYTIAAFFDLENVAIGVRDADFAAFQVELVLERLIEKGNVVVKKAYADWSHWSAYKRPFHEAAIEMVDMPATKLAGKNSADIKMVVDAMELCFTKPHIDAFALVTGDSDFSPLVSKLRENGKHTIGVGVKNSASHLLIDNCDEFVLYDDLVHKPARGKRRGFQNVPERKADAFRQLLDASEALLREDKALHSSLVKETMKRKQPQFNEEYHGYSSFTRLLEDAERNGLVQLRRDARSGTYVIDEVVEAEA